MFMFHASGQSCDLNIQHSEETMGLGDKSSVPTTGRATNRFVLDGFISDEEVFLLDTPATESPPLVIVDRNCLRLHNPQIYLRTGCIRITRPDNSKVSTPIVGM